MAVPRLAETALQRLAGLEPFPQPPLIPLQSPLVLMHGFGMLAGLRRRGHLHEEAMHLRRRGVRAYAPNVAPYDTILGRAAQWEARLEYILEETKAEKVCLVAHSMGGLDARYLISRRGFHRHVHALVTVATPHHGSALAQFVLEQPERLRLWAADLVNWMGAAVLDDATADVLTALRELTPEHVTQHFNAATPDHPDVRYWSYAGQAGKGTALPINPFLRLFNTVLFAREGPNDGFVSVQSAQWGSYLGVVGADHTQQVGLPLPLRSAFSAATFYADVACMLAREGF